MKVGIMQPYFFPYIGYWQLINAVDKYVLLDDVNFIKRGWINRNNILINAQAHLFTIPLCKPSQNKLILETKLNWPSQERISFLKMIETSYKKAPYFPAFEPILKKIVSYDGDDLTSLIQLSLTETLRYLQIEKTILRSSALPKDPSLRAQARIIAICKQLQASMYINPIGGQELYQAADFQQENMELRFILTASDKIYYSQFGNEFVSNLSFLDMLMFNSPEQIKYFLQQYSLIA